MATDQDPDRQAYRAKLFAPDGQIAMTVEIMASSEAEAVARARTLAQTYKVELWAGNRLVATHSQLS